MEKFHNRLRQLFSDDYLAEKIKAKEEEIRKEEEIWKQEETAERRSVIKEARETGELEVEYALKWLPSEYIVIGKGENGIRLKCPSVSEESQEIDHIVVSPQGVFLIETKNYSGKIEITREKNWIRSKLDGVELLSERKIRWGRC